MAVSGPSGAGKSTHTALWNRLFETPLLNGDLNLIGIADGAPFVYGLPWCGTSGIYTPKTCPLGGITLLKRAASDSDNPMTEDEQQLSVMHRLISPSWTKDMVCQEPGLCFHAAALRSRFLPALYERKFCCPHNETNYSASLGSQKEV